MIYKYTYFRFPTARRKITPLSIAYLVPSYNILVEERFMDPRELILFLVR